MENKNRSLEAGTWTMPRVAKFSRVRTAVWKMMASGIRRKRVDVGSEELLESLGTRKLQHDTRVPSLFLRLVGWIMRCEVCDFSMLSLKASSN